MARTTPEAPAHLSEPARARWAAVLPTLERRGSVDLETLAAYCQVWARWREAESKIAQASPLVKTARGAVVASPLLAVSNQAGAQARALERQLGIGLEEASARAGISIRAFARSLGVDERAVRKGIGTGRVPASAVGRTPRGQPIIVDEEAARAAWAANASKPRQGAAVSAADTLIDVQRRVGEERARRLAFDNDQRAGLYVTVAEAKREAFDAARVIHEGLLNLPSRLAAELAAETDPAKVWARLDDEIRLVLQAIASTLTEKAAS